MCLSWYFKIDLLWQDKFLSVFAEKSLLLKLIISLMDIQICRITSLDAISRAKKASKQNGTIVLITVERTRLEGITVLQKS